MEERTNMQFGFEEIKQIYSQPILKLIYEANTVHQANFNNDIELCHLISIKTGGCPEDCAYCPQSNKYKTSITNVPLLPITEIEKSVKMAKNAGVRRICLGAAYRTPNLRALKQVCEYIKIIKHHGLETCATLGSLSLEQARSLKQAGLDYYNHNLDTSPEYYPKIITTRTFNERIETIINVDKAQIKVCTGGILGLGETNDDRIKFIQALYDLPCNLSSISINMLSKIPGTPLANQEDLDKFELIRTIATIRIIFTKARIRLSAGRIGLSEIEQATCFLAGANSIFYGEKLLTTPNNFQKQDQILLKKLGVLC